MSFIKDFEYSYLVSVMDPDHRVMYVRLSDSIIHRGLNTDILRRHDHSASGEDWDTNEERFFGICRVKLGCDFSFDFFLSRYSGRRDLEEWDLHALRAQ